MQSVSQPSRRIFPPHLDKTVQDQGTDVTNGEENTYVALGSVHVRGRTYLRDLVHENGKFCGAKRAAYERGTSPAYLPHRRRRRPHFTGNSREEGS